ncbi:MAG: hypothetical protein AVDCRST_MAG14-1241, partial [uncultured Rubrobacteraceae bacterium]
GEPRQRDPGRILRERAPHSRADRGARTQGRHGGRRDGPGRAVAGQGLPHTGPGRRERLRRESNGDHGHGDRPLLPASRV